MQWPLACTLGDDCFIQNYMDHDPGPGSFDFTCGPQTYDRHKGTDISLLTRAAMVDGVSVLAAAPGTVTGLRNSMADMLISDPAAPPVNGRDCGNGVVVDHGDGWESQYCHMKRGSIQVSLGQKLEAGDSLGQVGLSGRTEFPHLHLSLRQNGNPVDPFANTPKLACGQAETASLWQNQPIFQPGGLVSVGFADHLPEFDELKASDAAASHLPADAPALVIWAYVYGARIGDVLELTIAGPDQELLRQSVIFEKTQAQLFRASGKRNRGTWANGAYEGTVRLLRDGVEIDRRDTRVMLGI